MALTIGLAARSLKLAALLIWYSERDTAKRRKLTNPMNCVLAGYLTLSRTKLNRGSVKEHSLYLIFGTPNGIRTRDLRREWANVLTARFTRGYTDIQQA